MIALLAGLIVGLISPGQQGYVRVETANTVYEMSLTTLVILFVVTCGDLFVRVVGDPFLPFKQQYL